MSQIPERIVDFASRLLAGGVFEIVLLVVLIVIALILMIIAIWIAWKLLILLGKASMWLAGALVGVTQRRNAARREARLAAPPEVATGWDSSPRISLRKALVEARRMTGPEALRVLVVAGDGVGDLCRSAGLIPPGPGTVGVAAGDDFILIDATRAPGKALRRLARALPWNRPVDAVAAIVDSESIPAATLTRTASFARATGMRLALHLVLSTPSRTAAWRVVESDSRSGQALCTQLAHDTARIWLAGGARRGLEALSRAQAQHPPCRHRPGAGSRTVDIGRHCIAVVRRCGSTRSRRADHGTDPTDGCPGDVDVDRRRRACRRSGAGRARRGDGHRTGRSSAGGRGQRTARGEYIVAGRRIRDRTQHEPCASNGRPRNPAFPLQRALVAGPDGVRDAELLRVRADWGPPCWTPT